MTNPNKTKGSSAERAVVDHLRATGWPHAERRLAGSSKDRGDIAGVVGVVIEVKNCARTDLAGWLAEAEQERANDRADYGVVWHKRRGRANAADWFVTMDGDTFTRLLAAAGYGSGTEPRWTDAELDDCAFCVVRGGGRDRTAGCPIHGDQAAEVASC